MLSPLMTYKRFSKHNKSLILNFKLLLLISNKGNYESCSLDGCLNYVCLIVSLIVNVLSVFDMFVHNWNTDING